MKSFTPTPKVNKPRGSSSQRHKIRTALPDTATTPTISEHSKKNKSNPLPPPVAPINTSFLERQMNRMSEIYDETLRILEPIPEPDEFGVVKMRYQDLRRLFDQRRKLTYATGFFFGISTVMTDQRKKP